MVGFLGLEEGRMIVTELDRGGGGLARKLGVQALAPVAKSHPGNRRRPGCGEGDAGMTGDCSLHTDSIKLLDGSH